MKKCLCGKCGATSGAISLRREHMGNGTVMLVAQCILCGWRIEGDESLRRPWRGRHLSKEAFRHSGRRKTLPGVTAPEGGNASRRG